jgi:hypothetical protein
MNRNQRACLRVGLLLLIGATLFPPWTFKYARSSYGFLFHPPYGVATVNLTRLFVEWVLIALVTSGLFFSQSNSRTSTSAAENEPLEAPLRMDQERPENPRRNYGGRMWKQRFAIPLIVAFAVCAVGLAYYESRRIARDLPPTELPKLVGGAHITNYGRFVWNAYNGSDFVLTEIKTSISVFDEKGNAVISNRVYRVPTFDLYPQQTKELSTDVGFTLGEGQRWEFVLVGAKGRPE